MLRLPLAALLALCILATTASAQETARPLGARSMLTSKKQTYARAQLGLSAGLLLSF